MALMKCAECGRDISSKAVACPGCGAPRHGRAVLIGKGLFYALAVLTLIAWMVGQGLTMAMVQRIGTETSEIVNAAASYQQSHPAQAVPAPESLASSSSVRTEPPAAVLARIRAHAEETFPNDFSMQKFNIDKDVESWKALNSAK